jgi:hypothetical protein
MNNQKSIGQVADIIDAIYEHCVKGGKSLKEAHQELPENLCSRQYMTKIKDILCSRKILITQGTKRGMKYLWNEGFTKPNIKLAESIFNASNENKSSKTVVIKTLSDYSDLELKNELIERGWDVTCTRTL